MKYAVVMSYVIYCSTKEVPGFISAFHVVMWEDGQYNSFDSHVGVTRNINNQSKDLFFTYDKNQLHGITTFKLQSSNNEQQWIELGPGTISVHQPDTFSESALTF